MKYDEEKIDETTLALLYLVTWKEHGGARAWKGFDWDTLNRLHNKGLISNPKGKAKSIILTEQGVTLSRRYFLKLFASPSDTEESREPS
jgi:hypothetical protein